MRGKQWVAIAVEKVLEIALSRSIEANPKCIIMRRNILAFINAKQNAKPHFKKHLSN